MYKARQLITEQGLYIMYCALFLPYLTYCIEVWGGTYTTTIKPLVIMQKKAIRIICNQNYRDHTNELFTEKKILKLYDLFKVRISAIMYKARHILLPPRIQLIFQFKNECDAYSLRKHSYFQLKQYRTTKKGNELINYMAKHLEQNIV